MRGQSRTATVAGAFALVAAGLAIVPTASAETGPALFTGDIAAPTTTLDTRPGTAQTWYKSADAALVATGTEEIGLDIDGTRVTAVRDAARVTNLGSTVWEGQIKETRKPAVASATEVATDEENSVTLVRRGDGVTGSIRLHRQLYRVQPVPGGHAVTKVDETKMPPDHPRGGSPVPVNPVPATTTGTEGTTANTVYRVQVIGTSQAEAAYGGDMQAMAELAVSETNKGYANSGVAITAELSGYQTLTYTEKGIDTDLTRFKGTSDGYLDGVHKTRDTQKADVNVLIVADKSACGKAAAIGASASSAFAVVSYDCATGYYSFGHEIGHLQSARHDPDTDSSTTPYAYGHGYRYGTSWRTIMAYNCSSSCPRLNYWSNPRKTYNGVAMGTTTKSDNARVLENTKATIAGFR